MLARGPVELNQKPECNAVIYTQTAYARNGSWLAQSHFRLTSPSATLLEFATSTSRRHGPGSPSSGASRLALVGLSALYQDKSCYTLALERIRFVGLSRSLYLHSSTSLGQNLTRLLSTDAAVCDLSRVQRSFGFRSG